jgi:hypothetical protein
MADPEAIEANAILAEFSSLREEIDKRIAFQNTLVTFNVAQTATLVSYAVMKEAIGLLIDVGFLAAAVGFLWTTQHISVNVARAYIRRVLHPDYSRLAGRPALGWETFIHELSGSWLGALRRVGNRVGQFTLIWGAGYFALLYMALVGQVHGTGIVLSWIGSFVVLSASLAYWVLISFFSPTRRIGIEDYTEAE